MHITHSCSKLGKRAQALMGCAPAGALSRKSSRQQHLSMLHMRVCVCACVCLCARVHVCARVLGIVLAVAQSPRGPCTCRGLEPEEPITSSAYLCGFHDLEITAVFIDDIMQTPDQPDAELMVRGTDVSIIDTMQTPGQPDAEFLVHVRSIRLECLWSRVRCWQRLVVLVVHCPPRGHGHQVRVDRCWAHRRVVLRRCQARQVLGSWGGLHFGAACRLAAA